MPQASAVGSWSAFTEVPHIEQWMVVEGELIRFASNFTSSNHSSLKKKALLGEEGGAIGILSQRQFKVFVRFSKGSSSNWKENFESWISSSLDVCGLGEGTIDETWGVEGKGLDSADDGSHGATWTPVGACKDSREKKSVGVFLACREKITRVLSFCIR